MLAALVGAMMSPAAAAPPDILLQPASTTNNVGDTASFFVIVAGGTPPLSYAWHRYPTGPTLSASSFFVIDPVSAPDAGAYGVTVSGADGDSRESLPATLTVLAGSTVQLEAAADGSGSVASSPSGIACPGTCSTNFLIGDVVQFTATASTGWEFVGWTKDGLPLSTPPVPPHVLTVTADATHTVRAYFAPVGKRKVTVEVTGTAPGHVVSVPAGIVCEPICSAYFTIGETVTLDPQPGADSSFGNWSGGCSGAGPCSFALTADVLEKKFTARFVIPTHPLHILIEGSGSVTGPGINCPGDCDESYVAGATVVLTVAPAPGWIFASWNINGLDQPVAGPTVTNTMPATPRSVTFQFPHRRRSGPSIECV